VNPSGVLAVQPIDLDAAFGRINTHWDPHVAGELNGQQVKLVKLKGEFVWHRHEVEDELFLVHKGRLHMRFRDREVIVSPGQFVIVPHGVEHQPYAPEEVEVVLFEPTSTLNTGNVQNELTRRDLKRV
jgi:mannose-6-phosphate isomerase-like protein (cupin superfamily)